MNITGLVRLRQRPSFITQIMIINSGLILKIGYIPRNVAALHALQINTNLQRGQHPTPVFFYIVCSNMDIRAKRFGKAEKKNISIINQRYDSTNRTRVEVTSLRERVCSPHSFLSTDPNNVRVKTDEALQPHNLKRFEA